MCTQHQHPSERLAYSVQEQELHAVGTCEDSKSGSSVSKDR
jgi:hypothetical protein